MTTAGIVGVGLIGGSIAAGLTKAGWSVIGYDADADIQRFAADAGLVSTVAESMESLSDESLDVLIIAAPPKATVEILSGLTTSVPVMDVAGVKSPVVAAARHLESFVGTHPMAGIARHRTGDRPAWAIVNEQGSARRRARRDN